MNKLIRFFCFVVILVLPFFALAQNGPMGIGNADGSESPVGYAQPRLLLWLDGSEVVTTTGNKVTQWTDKSGNGHHFTPDAAANRPTFHASGGSANRPYLSFDGLENRLVCPSFEFPSSGYSIYFVIKSNDNKYGMFSYATEADPYEVNIYNDNGFQQQAGGIITPRASDIGNISNGTWNYGGIWWESSSSLLWEYTRSNGASGEKNFNFAPGFIMSQNGTAVIGDIQNAVNDDYAPGDAFQGQIAEIIIWEGVLSRPIGRMMRTYMHIKYGLNDNGNNWDKFQDGATGSKGEYYTPIGIGRDAGSNPGMHSESRSEGLVLRVHSDEWTQNMTYLCAASDGAANSSVNTNLPANVEKRWNRTYEINGSGGSTQRYRIGFDFGEGINGNIPQIAENYVLLKRTGTSDVFTIMPESQIIETSIIDDEVVFTVLKSSINSNNTYYTIGTKNAIESSLDGTLHKTWYAYQSGNWDDPTTWTLDGSAAPSYVNPDNTIPASGNSIYIGSGRKVTVVGTMPAYGTLKVFGTLDIASAPTPTFSAIAGNGLIRCAGNGGIGNFPIGNSTAFADPVNGGTTEFYGNGGFTQSTEVIVNKLKINLDDNTDVMTLSANLTHNGMFEINQGTLEINNGSTSQTFTSNGGVLIESQGRIRTSTSDNAIKHIWNFEKDLIIEGDLQFTSRTTPDYTTVESNQHIIARFISGASNQELRINGNGYFSKIEVNKGGDMTYVLSIGSSAADKFKLLGPCNYSMGDNSYYSTNNNSFALINGTAEIKEHIFIPLHHNSGNYNINQTAMLWVNGGTVTKGFPSGSEAIVLYGALKVSAGELNANCTSGLTLRESGLLQIDGGIINANQIRTSNQGAEHIGGVIINGGQIFLDGTAPGGILSTYYTFSLTYPGNLFRMTGGELHVKGPTGRGLLFINSDPANTSVTGGTVFLDIANTSTTHILSSRAAFWDLSISRSATTGANQPIIVKGGIAGNGTEEAEMDDQNLIIRNNLFITGSNGTTLNMGTGNFIADLYLDGDFTIEEGCNYNHNNNTTHFVGNASSYLSFYGSSPKEFHNIEVNKASDTRHVTIQSPGSDLAMTVSGNLNLEKGIFNNATKNVDVKGNIINRSRFGLAGVIGFIRMNGSGGRQEIFSDNGIFEKLVIDNSDGVILKNDGLTIKNWLKLENGSFFIGDNKLRLDALYGDPYLGFSTTKFIVCSGNASAGGVEILNTAEDQEMEYKFGVNTPSGQKYTPAFVNINGGYVDEGYIRIAPVDTVMPTSDGSSSLNYLNYYWRVMHSEFTELPNITHRFVYSEDDIRGLESSFASGRVRSELPFARNVDNSPGSSHIDAISKTIYYNGTDAAQSTTGNGTPLVNADYSAGDEARFSGSPKVFFSKNDANDVVWNIASNWNELSTFTPLDDIYDYHSSNGANQLNFPGAGDVAIIGFDVDNISRKPHVYVAPAGGIEASVVSFTPLQDPSGNRLARYNASGSLGILRPTLKLNSTADIIKVQQISGEGALWLKDDIDLGVSDIGGFLEEDSSVVIIGLSASKNMNFLPPNLPNLFVATGSPTFTTDMEIRGNFEIAGGSKVFLSTNYTGDIKVGGDLILARLQGTLDNAELYFRKGNVHRTLTIGGDLKILTSNSKIEISTIGSLPITPVEWSPSEITGYLWFDASDVTKVQTAGGLVTGWTNKGTASGENFVQSENSKRPAYIPLGLSGKNTLRFDGIDDFLSIANSNFNLPSNQNFELFTVIKQSPGSQQYRAVLAKGEVAPSDFLLYIVGSNQYKLYVDASNMDMTAPNNMHSNANLGWARRQGQNGAIYNTKGGSKTQGSAASATMEGNTSHLTIGAARNGEARFFTGDIAEIFLIKRALTNEERQQMEGYLAHKWGLQDDLPGSHLYKATKPMVGGVNNNLQNQLIVEGNIVQNTVTGHGLNLFLSTGGSLPDTSFVNLILRGSGNHTYTKTSGGTPRLWKIEVDKGIDLNSGFTFNSDIDLFGVTNELEKPIELKNGLLKLNHSEIDLTFSSGGGDFAIPSTAGLEINAGNYKITGTETGLLLDGSLKLTGGSFNFGATEGDNNYIEYTASGASKIIIEGGNLSIGSQIRRGLTNTGGILKYSQTGGNVEIGKYSSPATNRGMLEIVNAGSSFEHTGGNLSFIRGVNSSTTPSLLIETNTSNVSGNSLITIGNETSPSGGQIQNFGIKSNIALNRLTINNDSEHNPVVKLVSVGLTLNSDLNIDSDATLNCGDQDLLLLGDVQNDGLLSSTNSMVTFHHTNLGEISGAGVFDLFDLERSGGSGGLTTVTRDLLVKNDFNLDAGTIDFNDNNLTVRGDVIADGEALFSSTSSGLIFDGSNEQKLNRSANGGTTKISVITVNNSSGVFMNNGSAYHFVINEKLRLTRGVLNLQGNLLELGLDATIEEVNPFGEFNMISTGGAFTNFGVIKNVYANSNEDIFIPLGIDKYMPVRLDFAQLGYTSGSTNSSFLLKLNVPEHPIRIDPNNVLGMYFSIDASNIGTGLSMDVQFQYDESYIQTTGNNTEANYIGARVYDGDVFKFDSTSVNEITHTLTWNFINKGEEAIDGDYFAGINTAIPDIIPEYHTSNTGVVGDPVYEELVPGGGAPSGADVYILDDHVLTFDQSGVNFYRTFITENATLKIDGSSFHRLGKVTGKGTIHLVGTGSLPSGEYNTFFACFGGKLIYEGESGDDFEILSNLPTVRKVDIIGSANSNIRFANNNATICEDLTISGPQISGANGVLLTVKGDLDISSGTLNIGQGNLLVEGNMNLLGGASGGKFKGGNFGLTTIEGDLNLEGNNLDLGTNYRETEIRGNITKTSGTITGGIGGARLKMAGETDQYIKGSFTGTSKIPFLHIANPSGVTLHSNVEISDTLKLESGNLNTGIDSLVFLTLDGTDVDPVGGSPTSFVNGPMKWKQNAGSTQRIFPIGKNDRYRPVYLTSRSGLRTWEVEYYDTVATVQSPIVTSMNPNPNSPTIIESVSIQEHWRINHDGGDVSARVSLSWGENSAVETNPSDYSKLLVLSYNNSNNVWDSYGGSGHSYDAGTSTGDFVSTAVVNFSQRYFTLGSSDAVNPLPVTWLYFRGETQGDHHILEWATASEKNNEYFELERSIDAQNWLPVANIAGAGYSITQSNYSHTDRDAPYGRVYYRIRQVDFDGEFDMHPNLVSLERALKSTSEKLEFVIYPNPTKYQTIRMMIPGYEDTALSIMISDLSGKVLSSQIIQVDGQGISQQIDCNFSPGIYLVTVMVEDKMRSKPFVISK